MSNDNAIVIPPTPDHPRFRVIGCAPHYLLNYPSQPMACTTWHACASIVASAINAAERGSEYQLAEEMCALAGALWYDIYQEQGNKFEAYSAFERWCELRQSLAPKPKPEDAPEDIGDGKLGSPLKQFLAEESISARLAALEENVVSAIRDCLRIDERLTDHEARIAAIEAHFGLKPRASDDLTSWA